MSYLFKSKPTSRDSSPATSHGSLLTPGSRSGPGPRGSSTQQHQPPSTSAFTSPTPRTAATGPATGTATPLPAVAGTSTILPPAPPSLPLRESTRATTTTDRTDALWAEMQATLEAVELSANTHTNNTIGASSTNDNSSSIGGGDTGSGSGAPRVFSPEHERKLDELRAAQIALAQAWARSEADEAIETTASAGGGGISVAGGGAAGGGGEGVAAGGGVSEGKSVATDGAGAGAGGGGGGGGKSTVGTGSATAAAAAAAAARPGSSGVGMGPEKLGAKMEEETEVDILLARKRREANDRYFQRVNQGVLDVVAKLEEVAVAMRAVEQKSKELWGDGNESVTGSAKA